MKADQDRIMYLLYNINLLEKLNGLGLLNKMFLHDGEKNNLCYYLEFSNDFNAAGGIGGGAATKYTLFKSAKTKKRNSGYSRTLKEVDEKEAIDKELLIELNNYYMKKCNIAKNFLKKYNNENYNGKSECIFTKNNDFEGLEMHHIFPVSDFPQIQHYYENIIALTPTQHLIYAHPEHNTHLIDEKYQKYLLLSKSYYIQNNILNDDDVIYDFDKLVYVLNVGFDKDYEVDNNDFIKIKEIIVSNYE